MNGELDEKGLDAAHNVIWPATEWNDGEHACRETVRAAIRAYLAASPSPSMEMEVVEGLLSNGQPLVTLSQAQSALAAMRAERDRWEQRFFKMDRNFDRAVARAETAEAQVLRLTEENEALRKDKDRLDYLDSLNAALNARYGTKYGWELIVNHNVTRVMFNFPRGADLNDAAAHGCKSCRDAIDRRMAEGVAYRRAQAAARALKENAL